MKIQCDVCNAAAAAVFCAADDAALCGSCDRRVHQANKLASRHPRLSLLHPPSNCSKQSHHSPLCDICQERRAVLFCLQDRAVLCNDCDVPVHNANEHTQKHSRFLITRVKLSSSAPHYPTPLSPDVKFDDMNPKPAPISEVISSPLSSMMGRESCNQWAGGGGTGGGWSSGSDGMLSEVLMMEMLDGGWHFEDSVDSCSTSVASFGFTKFAGHSMNFALQNDDGFAASPYTELGNRPMRPLFIESTGIWVPDAPACELYPTQFSLPLDRQAVSYKETGRYLKKGDSFTVPHVISPSRQDSTLLGFSCSADHIWRR